MTDLSKILKEIYVPKQALVVFQKVNSDEDDVYVEMHDVDDDGAFQNAHPLTEKESIKLGQALLSCGSNIKSFLQPEGLLPLNVLYVSTHHTGRVIWYTPPARQTLHFVKGLGIPSGEAPVPALLWVATLSSLRAFALVGSKRPTEKTRLYYAPFFNIGDLGSVCMGTVVTDFSRNMGLEGFMAAWQDYFWNSYFSHALVSESPVEGNIIEFWQSMMKWEGAFPVKALKKTKLNLGQLLKQL